MDSGHGHSHGLNALDETTVGPGFRCPPTYPTGAAAQGALDGFLGQA
jgi:hypothetical protein